MLMKRNVFSTSLASSAVSSEGTALAAETNEIHELEAAGEASLRCAGDELRGVAHVIDRVARVDPLRAEGDEDVLADDSPGCVERIDEEPPRGPGYDRALHDDERAVRHVLQDHLARARNGPFVRPTIAIYRRGHGDQDDGGVANSGRVRGGLERARLDERRDQLSGNAAR